MAKRRLNKAQQRLAADYKAFVASLENRYPKFARETSHKEVKTLTLNLNAPPGRETVNYPSKVTAGGTTAKVAKTYTGDQILGISAMHKSNLVPVFSQEQAQDISKMRRN
jgi:hypothetical protein